MSKHGYGAMRVDPASGAVLGGPLVQVYVYEAPVRIWHWVMVIAMFVLAATGYLIGSPWSGPREQATFTYFFGNIRMVHFIAGMIFAVAFAVRVYWAIVGNHHARAIFVPPVWSGSWWKGLFGQARYYLFMKKESALWIGHNPLAQLAMFAMYVLGSIVIILTGLSLYAEQHGWGSLWMSAFGWVNVLLGSSQMVRTVHHFAMYYLLIFAIVHMYMAIREDIMSQESVVGTMISGVRSFKAGARVEKV
ncbi:MAG TPA: Ni/Fe-hydrogenase, b-type cytochrome subunit [Burkholderiaceae bacterium]|nr:Ni/Fe-hydrogenase, b-type cytochrome subunit [Burkholderiaceae bacterium]